jgi:hypothetical protein
MKKLICILLILTLTGCSKTETVNKSTEEMPTELVSVESTTTETVIEPKEEYLIIDNEYLSAEIDTDYLYYQELSVGLFSFAVHGTTDDKSNILENMNSYVIVTESSKTNMDLYTTLKDSYIFTSAIAYCKLNPDEYISEVKGNTFKATTSNMSFEYELLFLNDKYSVELVTLIDYSNANTSLGAIEAFIDSIVIK